jgi:hypothetical protein
MRHYILLIFACLSTLNISAYNGRVTDVKNNPVIGATVSVMGKDSTIIAMTITDAQGLYTLDVSQFPATVRIESLGYKGQSLRLEQSPSSRVETVLEEDVYQLDTVVVTPEMMQHFDSHTSFRLPQKDLMRYSNFSQALNLVPFMMVTSSGNLSYKGNSNVILLLNGVQTTWEEIQSLRKEDINKVDVYENPPAQYALAGANAVINILTKRNLTGGNLSFNLRDSFSPLYGNNSFAGFYNYKQSRFSLMVCNSLARYHDVRTDETLQYEFDGQTYDKRKLGLDSPQRRDNNSITLGYMYHKPDKFQFNANLTTTFYKDTRDKWQDIEYRDEYQASGSQYLYNRYRKDALNLYFNKMWKDGRSLLLDVTGTLYDTKFRSNYQEWSLAFDSISNASAYTTDRKSVLSTLQYTMPSSWGQWTFGLRDSYHYAEQQNASQEITQKQQVLHGYAQLYGGKGKWNYQFILAAKYLNLKNQEETLWSKWYPAPSASLWFRPQKNVTFQFLYRYDADVPSTSLMSETEQWLDTHYVYKGNSTLTPYSNHQAYLTANLSSPHLNVSLLGLYSYSPKAIVNYFEATPLYILQTYANLKSKQEMGGQLVVDCFPLKDKSLKIGAVGIYIHHEGKELEGTSWSGYRYQFMAYVAYTLPKWECEVYYQYPGQTLNGQLITPRAEVLRLDVSYKPLPNMSVGLQWNQPFMKGFKEGEHTTESCLIQSYTTTNIRDYANMVCVKFAYNFSFGRQGKHPAQRVKNEDSDSGLLVK